MIALSRSQARRIAVAAQQLTDAPHSALLTTAGRLGGLLVDTTDAVAPHVDLVLWSRLGPAFHRADLEDARAGRDLVEINGWLRPASEVGLYLAELASWPGEDPPAWRRQSAAWLDANRACAEEVLQALRSEGPLPAKALPNCADGYRSSGWNNDKNSTMLLERLAASGQVAVSHREGRERHWDLAERVFPEVDAVPLAEAVAERARRRLAALGIARAKAAARQVEPDDVGELGVEVSVDGVRGTWRVQPDLLDAASGWEVGAFPGRVAVLSPFDRLLYDRKRMAELFEFDYAVEMYKPAAQRRWGYFALPILVGDALVGKVDCTADRRAGLLRVHAIHEDEPFPDATSGAVRGQVLDLGRLLGLEVDVEED